MKLTTLNDLNDLLQPYNACIATNNSLLQSKAPGYIGDAFINSKKQVYDFQIVSKSDKKSWANIYSDIYQKIPKHILNEIHNAYFETSTRIYC
jgi:hypothetical protein